MTIYIKFNNFTDSIMAIAEDIFPSFSVMFATICACKKLNALNFIIICMSYDANASMCNLKLIYPFIILYVVLCYMS